MTRRILPSCLLSMALHAGLAGAQTSYSITDLGVLPGHITSSGLGVNNAGQVVGFSYDYSANIQRAFIWDSGVMTEIPPLSGGPWATAYRINACGTVVGQSAMATGPGQTSYYGFTFDMATATLTGLLCAASPPPGPPFGSDARTINDRGMTGGKGAMAPNIGSALLWDNSGACQGLGDSDANSTVRGLNNDGWAAASLRTFDGFAYWYHGFVWNGTGLIDLSTLDGPTGHSQANDINERGQAVGSAEHRTINFSHAFKWEAGVLTDLDSRGPVVGTLSQALAINNLGQIVGSGNVLNHPHWDAILWDAGGMHVVADLLPPGHGWDLLDAADISDTGFIVGTGYPPGGVYEHAFLLTPIAPNCRPCDANCDGAIDGLDIAPFVSVLSGSPGCSPCAADANFDGAVDLADISRFVECLIGC